MPTVLLIRHGESKSNKGLPSFSPKLTYLTGAGKRQAKDIARKLKAEPPDLIVISSYQRSRETAIHTLEVLPGVPAIDDWPVHEFTYLTTHLKFDKYTTVEDRKPLVETYWDLAEPQIIDGPGAESFEQFIKRVWDVKERLEETPFEKVAIFSHEQFISAFRWLLERDSPEVDEEAMREFRRYVEQHPLKNGEIVSVKVREMVTLR